MVIGVEAILNLLRDWCTRKAGRTLVRCSTWAPISFDVFVYEVFTAIVSGSELCITPERVRPDPAGFAAWLHEERIDSAFVPAFTLPSVLERVIAGYRPSILLVGVEPIAERLLHQLIQHAPDLLVINGYGPTEATVYCTAQTHFANRDGLRLSERPYLGRKFSFATRTVLLSKERASAKLWWAENLWPSVI